MSFDKVYPNRKDRRKPFRGSRQFDGSCRNHKSCPWCERNRRFQYLREVARSTEDLKEFENGE